MDKGYKCSMNSAQPCSGSLMFISIIRVISFYITKAELFATTNNVESVIVLRYLGKCEFVVNKALPGNMIIVSYY